MTASRGYSDADLDLLSARYERGRSSPTGFFPFSARYERRCDTGTMVGISSYKNKYISYTSAKKRKKKKNTRRSAPDRPPAMPVAKQELNMLPSNTSNFSSSQRKAPKSSGHYRTLPSLTIMGACALKKELNDVGFLSSRRPGSFLRSFRKRNKTKLLLFRKHARP